MDELMEKYSVPQELIGLLEVNGVSISDGLRYCGSIRDFERFLESFYMDIDFKSNELETAYNNQDISYLTIKAHALKTSAKVIGAVELSELAYAVELAGKTGNLEYIDDNISGLVSLLRSYKERLGCYMLEKLKQRAKRPISDGELKEAFSALREVAPTFDYDAMEMILEELSLYQLPEGIQREVEEINSLLHRYDWDHLEELLGVRTAV